ncbi:MAG: Flp pilus assembly protein TadD [Bacteroidia bacterium]|jgi:Flp pilus assembly protein TadD
MVIPRVVTARWVRPMSASRWILLVPVLIASMAMSACTTLPSVLRSERQVNELPPIAWEGDTASVADVRHRVTDPDLLSVSDEMREFVERYTSGIASRRQRLRMLHAAVKGAATLGIEYDPGAGGGAQDVFHRGSANCLSYASLFIALAREAGLDAGYQWLEVRPSWTRYGERVLVGLHVNASVDLGRQERYMIDIDPLPSREIAGTQRITDDQAIALHHGNTAMQALGTDDVITAWLHTVRALQLHPQQSHMWVNLGAIYRAAGQHREAERSYLYALELDPWENSAMNNLVVLYAMDGRETDRQFWEGKVSGYRESNPFYHAWLGDQAAEKANWQAALENYQQALRLSPQDSQLLFALGTTHEQLGQSGLASRFIQRAIELATLRSEVDVYRAYLRKLQEGS